MSDELRKGTAVEERDRPGESLLQRIHRRKTEARRASERPAAADPGTPMVGDRTEPGAPLPPELTDADMPPIESLTGESDYTGFLSAKVSEGLRRAALRKLFHGAQFNVLDELDDYAEDFTSFTALGDMVTAEMRHRIEAEARKRAEAVKQALLDEPGEHDAAPPTKTVAEQVPAIEAPPTEDDDDGAESAPSSQQS